MALFPFVFLPSPLMKPSQLLPTGKDCSQHEHFDHFNSSDELGACLGTEHTQPTSLCSKEISSSRPGMFLVDANVFVAVWMFESCAHSRLKLRCERPEMPVYQ